VEDEGIVRGIIRQLRRGELLMLAGAGIQPEESIGRPLPQYAVLVDIECEGPVRADIGEAIKMHILSGQHSRTPTKGWERDCLQGI